MEPQIAMPAWPMLGDPGLSSLPFQDSVLDGPPVNTRAGLYVYLNTLIRERPSFDDALVLTFLNTRYNGDVPSLVSDLILASFDILANATHQSESPRTINIIRSFLVNKLPVFLHSNYAALFFEPLTIEQCIRQALGRIDPAAFPSFSQLFDFSASSVNAEARQEFLFACALHQLIQEHNIEDILEEVTMQSLPAGGKYVQQDLVNQCTANPQKIDQFVGELENMEGNAGQIAGAVIEILHMLCTNRDTMTLKGICNTLSRKPVALDVIMLFTSSRLLMQPLCHLLDHWEDHEDQNEYQPVYDEFGSILLLVAMVQHRFKLKPEELGLQDSSSFVWMYLKTRSTSVYLGSLPERESEILGAWIKGLFETEGISDELMSMCKPSEFHLLVPTLFDQSLRACQTGVLTIDTLKGGFEYLLEPFLLPSLVAGLNWFAENLSEASEKSVNLDVILQALQSLVMPVSISHDSSAIHAAVLSITARPLINALLQVQKQHSSQSAVANLLQTLSPYYDGRPAEKMLKELQGWATYKSHKTIPQPNGLQAALRDTIRLLAKWSTGQLSHLVDLPRPDYNCSQLQESITILGAKIIFETLFKEVREAPQSSMSHNDPVYFDIFAVMIVASQQYESVPATRSPQIRLSLYDILQIEYQQTSDLSQVDLPRATGIVQLYRRVHALMGQKPPSMMRVDESSFMADVVEQGSHKGLPAADIDDVLAEAHSQNAEAQAFLDGDAAILGMA